MLRPGLLEPGGARPPVPRFFGAVGVTGLADPPVRCLGPCLLRSASSGGRDLNYAVLLMGENFLVAGQPGLRGFFITRRIDASSEEIAKAQAIAAVMADAQLSRAASVEPTVTVKAVHPIAESSHVRETRYFFFPMAATQHEQALRAS